MKDLFSTVLDMSITASVLIPIVLLVRLLIRRAPRYFSYLLWIIPAFRLCCPVSVESVLSIFNLFSKRNAEIAVINPTAPVRAVASISAQPVSQGIELMDVLGYVWLGGTALLLIYSFISYILLYRKVRTAVRYIDNIFCVDDISSPFILGFIRPKIYIPFGLDDETLGYVLAHEKYHIRRGDHIVKLFAFLILSVHWFNPLCWLSFILMSRDVEFSCDEKVLSKGAYSKIYGMALLSFAAKKRFPSPAPVAFGEVSVKQRIRNVLKWKKPAVWLSVGAMAVCIAMITVCTCNAKSEDMSEKNSIFYEAEKIIQTSETEKTKAGNLGNEQPIIETTDTYEADGSVMNYTDDNTASSEGESVSEPLITDILPTTDYQTEVTASSVDTSPIGNNDPIIQNNADTQGITSNVSSENDVPNDEVNTSETIPDVSPALPEVPPVLEDPIDENDFKPADNTDFNNNETFVDTEIAQNSPESSNNELKFSINTDSENVLSFDVDSEEGRVIQSPIG